jgi:hypothetical protein
VLSVTLQPTDIWESYRRALSSSSIYARQPQLRTRFLLVHAQIQAIPTGITVGVGWEDVCATESVHFGRKYSILADGKVRKENLLIQTTEDTAQIRNASVASPVGCMSLACMIGIALLRATTYRYTAFMAVHPRVVLAVVGTSQDRHLRVQLLTTNAFTMYEVDMCLVETGLVVVVDIRGGPTTVDAIGGSRWYARNVDGWRQPKT